MNRLRRIRSVQGIPAFAGLTWDAVDADRFNLVYGWNASGKTTLSRVLRCFEVGEVYIDEFSSLSFSLDTDNGTIARSHIESEKLAVRVFNEDFVAENLRFDSSAANPIIILGQDNVKAERDLKDLEQSMLEAQQDIEQLEGRLDEVPDLEAILTDCGREVVAEFAGTPLASSRYDGRRYTRRNVQQRIDNDDVSREKLEALIIDDSEDLKATRERLTSEFDAVRAPQIGFGSLERLFEEANELLQLSLETETIERFEDDDELREWIHEGYRIHGKREESGCLFCGRDPMPENLLTRYGAYFTQESMRANAAVDRTLGELREQTEKLECALPDSGDMFSDLRGDFRKTRRRFEELKDKLQERVHALERRLEKRKGRMEVSGSKQDRVPYPNEAVVDIEERIKMISELCAEHNDRLQKRDKEVDAAAEALELHRLASTLKDRKYFDFRKRKNALEESVEELRETERELQEAIHKKHAALRDAGIAVEDINAVLEDFLGPDEIELEIVEEPEGKDRGSSAIGYRLTSRGQPIRHLSDGEKSVVALAYFLVSLRDEDCDLEETIVVLDDPVDSQDGVFLYQTFGLLKRRLYNAGQVFVFTHNYQLFNVVRDWLCSEQFHDESALFRIKMRRGAERRVLIEDLPRLLKDYKTEYQYLVARLEEFRENPTPEDAPVVPNIARKVVENFAAFKWSCRTSQGLLDIVHSLFIQGEGPHRTEIGEAVVKFVHEYSHGHEFDRPVTTSAMEAVDIADSVLKFIYWADQDHYESLMRRI